VVTADSPPPPSSLFMRRLNLDDLPPLDLPNGYVVRAATDADADALAALLGGAFPEMSWTAANVRERLLDESSVRATFVIDREGIPVATASARIMPDDYPGSGYIHWVGTAPGHRGKRLGSLVSLATLHEFVRLGCVDAVLETDDFRVPAIKVYLALGFCPEYRHPTHAPRWAALASALTGYR
jgi:mycothiol synthase